jgi:hypothetical protein
MTRPDLDAIRARWRKRGHSVADMDEFQRYARTDIPALLAYIDELEREVARLRKGEECHVARPGEGTYECRHDNLCAACRLRSAEARANRATYTVGETEWALRIAVAEQRFVAAEREIAELKARIVTLEALKEKQ